MVHDAKSTSSVKHGGGSAMAWAFVAANGTSPLVFTDDVTSQCKWIMSQNTLNKLKTKIKAERPKNKQ